MTASPRSPGTMIVTGGAGFIGCNFVRHALASGAKRVVVLDKLTYAGHRENIEPFQSDPRFEFIQGDIADAAAVRALIQRVRPTSIVNMAAETHVDRSIDGPALFVRTNVMGTIHLLEAARAFWSDLPEPERVSFRFVHVSTDEVYGSLGPDGLFSETTPYSPNSPYAASKAGADHLVRAYFRTFGFPAVITNCSNNYGPYQFPEKLIPLMILNGLEGRALPVYGDGGNVRDWIFVEDHCAGVAAALAKGRIGESYNLGARAERTNVQIVEAICDRLEALKPAAGNRALSSAGVRSYRGLIQFVKDRPGHDRRYAVDPAKAERELHWSPRHDFAAGLKQTVAWYVENRRWCDAVQKNVYGRERLGLTAPVRRAEGESS